MYRFVAIVYGIYGKTYGIYGIYGIYGKTYGIYGKLQ
jgi:hypothetical protein